MGGWGGDKVKFCLLPAFLINSMRDIPMHDKTELDKFVVWQEATQLAR
jgi:hypothetical protein